MSLPTLLLGYDQVKSWIKPCQSEETFHLVEVYTIPMRSEMWETRQKFRLPFQHSPEWQNKFQNRSHFLYEFKASGFRRNYTWLSFLWSRVCINI